jgi:hypothetical protein
MMPLLPLKLMLVLLLEAASPLGLHPARSG